MQNQDNIWYTYILLCADGSYYIGSTNNLEKRITTHNRGKGAKYTRSRLPIKLIFAEQCLDKSQSLKREIALKKLTHAQKKILIDQTSLQHIFS